MVGATMIPDDSTVHNDDMLSLMFTVKELLAFDDAMPSNRVFPSTQPPVTVVGDKQEFTGLTELHHTLWEPSWSNLRWPYSLDALSL